MAKTPADIISMIKSIKIDDALIAPDEVVPKEFTIEYHALRMKYITTASRVCKAINCIR